MENVRALALTILHKITAAGQYSNIALDTAIKRSELSSEDRGLLTALVYGVLERQLTLDYCITSLSERSLEEIDPDAVMLLRLGLYQMAYLDRVPDHAAVNETVALAPRRMRGFINAILRSFARMGKQLPYPDRASAPVGYLSVRYSVNQALCAHFTACFGAERTESLLSGFERVPPLTVRVNTLYTSRDALMARWEAAGVEVERTPMSEVGLRILGKSPVTSLPGFEGGDFFVQDEASQLCVKALDARPGMRVLDACACPGSKSFGAAIDMQNRGEVVSCDLHANKLSLVLSGAERLGITVLTTHARDAREPNDAWLEQFDRVLCDVPCSGFGVLAKKPELRYKDPKDSERLPEIQREILKNASTYLKKGGKLVYSTCTLLPRENEEIVHDFLSLHLDFTLTEMRTLTPDKDGTDGFFYAVLGRCDA